MYFYFSYKLLFWVFLWEVFVWEGNFAESIKHALESESDQSTRNIGRSQKGKHYQFNQLGLVPNLGQWVPHDLTSEKKTCQQLTAK